MTLATFLRLLRRQFVLVISLTLIGAAGGAISAMLTPPRYATSTEVMLSVRLGDDATAVERTQSKTYATQAMTSYQSIVTSSLVLKPVIEDLGLSTTAAALAGRVTASVATNSTIMRITVTSSSPGQTARIANAIAGSFAETVTGTLEKRDRETRYSFEVVTLQQAQVPTQPVAPNSTLR